MRNTARNFRTALTLVLCATLFLALACAKQKPKLDENAYRREIDAYRSDRVKSLTSDDGWLTLVGLYWLQEGENKFGSDPHNTVALPQGKSSSVAGSFFLENGNVRIEANPNSGVTSEGKPVTSLALKTDENAGEPTVLHMGSLSFYVIKRGDQFGIRVKDSENPPRRQFAGIQYFPTDPRWRVEARFEPYNPQKKIPISNVLGQTSDEPSPGAIVFEMNGNTYRLDPILEEGNDELFIIFADQTSGRETYGAGRFLYVPKPGADNRIVIDFNKAYSPPCAFTPYATCPLPPQQNRLAIRVEAGEKKYEGLGYHEVQ